MLRNSVAKITSLRGASAMMASTLGAICPAPVVAVPTMGAKVNADTLRNGHLIEWEGKRVQVTSYRAAMMGRRPTSLHIDLRDTLTGKTYPQRFSPSDRVELIELDNMDLQFLYVDGDIAYAMHPSSFEQIEFDAKMLGNLAAYTLPDSPIRMTMYQGKPFSIIGRDYAFMRITETEHYSAESSTNGNGAAKPALLENGRTIRVSRFCNTGDLVKVRIDGEEFVSRSTPEEAAAYLAKAYESAARHAAE